MPCIRDMGSFVAIHALNSGQQWVIAAAGVSLIPLVGGIAGLGFAVHLWMGDHQKSGTTFAMITLGLGELVFAMCPDDSPSSSVAKAAYLGNRVIGSKPFFGITFGPHPAAVLPDCGLHLCLQWQLMYAFTRTPLGRMLNAVRDNPERVEFVGYDTQKRALPSPS
jgi:branched-chain amino acid transport system permease protein